MPQMVTTRTDVLECKIGTRRATLNTSDDALHVTSGTNNATVPFNNIKALHQCGSQVVVHLNNAAVIVPGTKHPREQFICTFAPDKTTANYFVDVLHNSVHGIRAVDYTNAPTYVSPCANYSLAMSEESVCAKIMHTQLNMDYNDIMAVLFQRTRGGMATFDALICYAKNVYSIERLSHGDMHAIAATFSAHGIDVIDAGPDPLYMCAVRNELMLCKNNRAEVRAVMSTCFDAALHDVSSDGECNDGDDDWEGSDEHFESTQESESESESEAEAESAEESELEQESESSDDSSFTDNCDDSDCG